MNQLFNKKIFIPAAIILILIIAGLFIKLTLLDKNDLLIDYLPAETEFWFWQNKGGFSKTGAALLGQVGLDKTIVKILQAQKDEIVIYHQNDRWYKIEAKSLDKARILQRKDDLWESLSQNRDKDIIGFLDKDYIKSQLGELAAIFEPNSYYFVLKQEQNVLSFSLIEKAEALKNKSIVKKPLALPLNIILALKLRDGELFNKTLEQIKKILQTILLLIIQ